MIELVAGLVIALGALGLRLLGHDREVEVELWQYVTYTGAALLALGLVRDVLALPCRCQVKPHRAGEPTICVESLTGLLLVSSGLALYLLDVSRSWHPALSSLGFYAGALCVVSKRMKDTVLVLRREKDHANLIPW
jgi:hypothetical protein